MSKIFLGGVPTGPEVERLMKEVEAGPGIEVSYETVEQLIDVKRTDHRFRSVTNSWRKRLFREKALEVKAEGGRFLMLTPDEALSSGINAFHKVGRALGRTSVKVAVINEAGLTPARAETKRLMQREIEAVTDATRKAVKTIAAPKPVSTVVRLHDKASGDA